ncbi:MAG: hypothetical protein WCT02_01295 [Candidatus Paceibacterota bacterium]
MKIKAACIGTPGMVAEALSSSEFAAEVLRAVVCDCLGVENVLQRPAEYYVQKADSGPSPKEGVMGVEVRLSGASRNGRTAKQFHTALKALLQTVSTTVRNALDSSQKCQVFVVIMLDGDIETAPGSGKYSSNLESEAVWI